VVKVVAISDTHNHLGSISVPDGDILVHAGDATVRGSESEWAIFNEALGNLPHKHKFVIPGNHDWICQRDTDLARALLTNATFLVDELVEEQGIRIYGSPWQPTFHNWAFNMHRGAKIKAIWDKIPENLDILITHGPPHGILDEVGRGYFDIIEHVGCEELMKAITNLKPKFHVFGHIHEGHGSMKVDDTTFINASIMDINYKPVNRPILFHI
jgi:Icc-related predicted phosphoesterase